MFWFVCCGERAEFFFFFAGTDSLPHCYFFSFFHWKRIASAERRCRRGSKHNRDENTGFSRRRLSTRAHNATPLCHTVESTMNSCIIRFNCDNERVWVCKRERERGIKLWSSVLCFRCRGRNLCFWTVLHCWNLLAALPPLTDVTSVHSWANWPYEPIMADSFKSHDHKKMIQNLS